MATSPGADSASAEAIGRTGDAPVSLVLARSALKLVSCWVFLWNAPTAVLAQPGSAEVRPSEPIEVSAQSTIEFAADWGQRSQKFELMIEPALKIELPRGVSLTAVGRLRADAFDRLERGNPPQLESSPLSRRVLVGDRVEIETRELYVRTSVGRTFLTFGKQYIVWGKADGLKVLDVVNPQEFREFILDEFDQSRLALWSTNAEVPIGKIVVQFIWIPDRTYHRFPEAASTFAFTTAMFRPTFGPGVATVILRPVQRPHRFFSDSDVGARLSAFWKGWDLTANYLFHYDDSAVPFRELSFVSGANQATVTPAYKRTHLVGGTFSNAFGSLTIRGEVGVSSDRFLLTNDLFDVDGVVQTVEVKNVLGFDWYGWSETLLSVQFFQNWAANVVTRLPRAQVETDVTVLLQREFLNDTLLAETMWLQNINRADGLVRPKISYELRDNIKLWIGADLFYGKLEGLFGQFADRDRFVMGIAWGI